jgi:hypothetical protein
MTLNLHHNFVLGGWMASESTEVLSAFLPIDIGACPPEHVLVPVIGILVVLLLSKIVIKVYNRLA